MCVLKGYKSYCSLDKGLSPLTTLIHQTSPIFKMQSQPVVGFCHFLTGFLIGFWLWLIFVSLHSTGVGHWPCFISAAWISIAKKYWRIESGKSPFSPKIWEGGRTLWSTSEHYLINEISNCWELVFHFLLDSSGYFVLLHPSIPLDIVL